MYGNLKRKQIRGLFLFQGPIGREIRTTVRISWSYAQMYCAMSLVCSSIATHLTCQFWARSEPVDMHKTTVSRQMWSECCNSIPLFIKCNEEFCPQVLTYMTNPRPHTAAATKRLLQRFRWEVFGHPPSTARAWPLWFSFLSLYETVVGGQLGTMSCRPTKRIGWKHRRLASMTRVLENWYHATKCLRRSVDYIEK